MSDYIELWDAIELCGERVIAGWSKLPSKLERHAPSRAELIAERAKILELPDKDVLADARATQRNRAKRLARERKIANQPLTSIDDAIAKLKAEIASTKDKRRKRIFERTLARLEKPGPLKSPAPSKNDLVNEHRNYLLEEQERLQTPAMAARERWDMMHDRLRRAVASGVLPAYARLPLYQSLLGNVMPLPSALFPEPGERRVDFPFGANGERFPAEIVFVRADIERLFFATPARDDIAEIFNRKTRQTPTPTQDRVRNEMLRDLESMDPKRDPRKMKQTSLPAQYGVKSRSTCKKALDAAVLLHAERQSATSDS
jgi:hypothetical protein